MICFEMYEGVEKEPLRKEIVEYLSEGFKTEFKEVNSKFFEYRSYVHIPSVHYLEKLQMYVESYFTENNFKTEIDLTIRFGRINRIVINYK